MDLPSDANEMLVILGMMILILTGIIGTGFVFCLLIKHFGEK